VIGKTYAITFTHDASTTGTLRVCFGGACGSTVGVDLVAHTETHVVTATSTAALYFEPNATWVGTIDNVSIKEITISDSVITVRNDDNTIGLEVRAGGSAGNNIFIGVNSGQANTTGIDNTALGVSALRSNTTGSYNAAQGLYSLGANTTGSYNTAQGYISLRANTTGVRNTAQGAWSLVLNTTGSYNTAQGTSSLYSNYTGSYNSVLGYQAAFGNISGSYNLALGYRSLSSNQTGSNNVSIGYNSGYNTTSSNNIFLGDRAGQNNTSGSTNIVIGYNVDVQSATTSNQLTIGNLIFGTGGFGTGTTIGTGNIGIGTATPGARLDVEMSAATVAIFNRTTDDGTIISLQQGGVEQGNIAVLTGTVSYNAFTGSHYGWNLTDSFSKGELVSYNGDNQRLHDNPESEILYGFSQTATENDPRVFGAYLGLQESAKPKDLDNPHLIMAVGNGDIWLVDEGQNVQAGDYLISSSTPGHARLDPRTDAISYVVARAAEDIDWSTVTETTTTGKKRTKVSVTFEVFARDNITSTMQADNIDVLNNLSVGTDLLVGNNADIGNNLNVTGVTTTTTLTVTASATIANLTVTDSVDITNNLTVNGDTTVADIYVNGHIISGGNVPVVIPRNAAGDTTVIVSNLPEVSPADATVDGNDTAGTVTITTGADNVDLGEVLSLQFSDVYSSAPRVILTAGDSISSELNIYRTVNEAGFTLGTSTVLQPNTTYTFDYFVIQ